MGRQNRRSLCTQTVGELCDRHCVQVAWIVDVQDMREFGNHYVGSIQKAVKLWTLPGIAGERNLSSFVSEPVAERIHVEVLQFHCFEGKRAGGKAAGSLNFNVLNGYFRQDPRPSQPGPGQIEQLLRSLSDAGRSDDVQRLLPLVEIAEQKEKERKSEVMIGMKVTDEDVLDCCRRLPQSIQLLDHGWWKPEQDSIVKKQ